MRRGVVVLFSLGPRILTHIIHWRDGESSSLNLSEPLFLLWTVLIVVLVGPSPERARSGWRGTRKHKIKDGEGQTSHSRSPGGCQLHLLTLSLSLEGDKALQPVVFCRRRQVLR